MTWIIILSILLFMIGWLLLAPVFLFISTSESKYEAGLRGVFKVMINVDPMEAPLLRGKLFFISFKIPVFMLRAKKFKAATPKKRKRKMEKMDRRRMRRLMKLVWKFIHSYRLKELKLNIDTGDVIRNAHLIPVFSIIHRDRVQLTVNYENKTEFLIHLQSSAGRMLYIMAKNYIKRTF